jgi:hypothetical protein
MKCQIADYKLRYKTYHFYAEGYKDQSPMCQTHVIAGVVGDSTTTL